MAVEEYKKFYWRVKPKSILTALDFEFMAKANKGTKK